MGYDGRLYWKDIPFKVRERFRETYYGCCPRRSRNFALFCCLDEKGYVLYGFFIGYGRGELRGLEIRVEEKEGVFETDVLFLSNLFKTENI
jgi:hypothetical protein